eukprot:maker-scaffold964_size76271-snap-gene-0.11 protein:Tk09567 transcript:maker-scaffold964_size76271-snap-gene-0.11-mRNA-1 annotation:"hypothetical protein LOTGIDRAFT_210534"
MDEIRSVLSEINHPNKVQRKKNLSRIQSALPNLSDGELEEIWSGHVLDLLPALQDESERCREISGQILIEFFEKENVELDPMANVLLPSIMLSVCGDKPEKSEEVRLVLIQILTRLTQKRFADKIRPFLDSYYTILQAFLLDPFAQIKTETCQCIINLSQVLEKDFHLNADSLLTNLIKNLNHAQQKVRNSTVLAIGQVCHHGSSDTFKAAAPQLAQRHFDPIPAVRATLVRVAGSLAVNWQLRHENDTLLLPLLITSLEDEHPDNRELARTLWIEAGERHLKDELAKCPKMKDLVDFPADPPQHYPPNVERPTLGCRLWVKRIFLKIKEALAHDLKDWLVDTRIKTSQLTYILILHMEQDILAFAENVLNLFYLSVRDSEPQVQDYIFKSAELFGYFVAPTHWIRFITTRIHENPSVPEIQILSKIIQGSDPVRLVGFVEDIGFFLRETDVCLRFDDVHMATMLDCCETIVQVCGATSSVAQSSLFRIAFSVLSLAKDATVGAKARAFLVKCSNLFGHDTYEDLVKTEIGPILKEYQESCSDWGSNSYEICIFTQLLQEASGGSGYYAKIIVNIFQQTLKDGNPPELKTKILVSMAKQMLHCDQTLNSQSDFQSYSQQVITDLILPHLDWHAGQKAQAVRTAAITALWSIFVSKCVDFSRLCPILEAIVPKLNRLVEDSSDQVRSFTLKAFYKLFDIALKQFPEDNLVKSGSIIQKRLDDVSDEVRGLCLDVLEKLSDCLPQSLSPSLISYLGQLYPQLVLHMDDPNPAIRASVLGALKTLSLHSPVSLQAALDAKSSQHKHQDEIRTLKDHLQSLSLKNGQ